MTKLQTILEQQLGTLDRLRQADQLWYNLRTSKLKSPQVINQSNDSLEKLDHDVIICGSTLGILLGAALQKQGWKVAVVEKGILKGREQEWNISRKELEVFVELELLTLEELEQAIVTEYNPARISFSQDYELFVNDILNIGIDPVFLLETLKQKFIQFGGVLLENTPFKQAIIHPNGAQLIAGEQSFNTRLLIDAMGHFSPIAQQARGAIKPDGICLVVGSCAAGFPENNSGDLIVSFTPIKNKCQYFWEAFPARDGRTTYLFTYVDANPERPSLEWLMSEYLELLPEYQKVPLSQLQFKRFLFGFFPSYRQSPLHLPWNRVLAVGDSSGAQSPVSFGGFGAMVRHLKRLTNGIDEALKVDTLDQKSLQLLQPYQPNISVTWLFQKTMSVGIDQEPHPEQINQLMSGVFRVMDNLGEDVLYPFLQDVVQFSGLLKTLPLVNPKLVLPLLPQIGISTLGDWLIHYLNLALYSGLYPVAKSTKLILNKLPPQQQYYWHRYLDAWQYGSGGDY